MTTTAPLPTSADIRLADVRAAFEVRLANAPAGHADHECLLCEKPLTEKAADRGYWVHLSTRGVLVGTSIELEEKDDQGWFPVGAGCAKRLPLTHRLRFAA